MQLLNFYYLGVMLEINFQYTIKKIYYNKYIETRIYKKKSMENRVFYEIIYHFWWQALDNIAIIGEFVYK